MERSAARRRIVEKVRKCLALARSDNANEAATALRQARAMMAEHGIEERAIHVEGARAKNGRGETAARWRVMLGNVVCEAIGLRMIQIRGRGAAEVEFIGVVPRPEIGAYAFEVLRRQLEADRRKFVEGLRCRRPTKTRRGDLFAEGWILEVRAKVAKLRVDDDERRVVDDSIEKEHPDLEDMEFRRRSGRAGRGDFGALMGGRAAGRRAKLNAGVNGREVSLVEFEARQKT